MYTQKNPQNICFGHSCKCGVRGCTRNVYLYLHYPLLLIPLELLQDTMHSTWYIDINFTNKKTSLLHGCSDSCNLHIQMEHQRTRNSDQAWTQRSTAPRGNGISTQSEKWDMFRLTFVIRYWTTPVASYPWWEHTKFHIGPLQYGSFVLYQLHD